MFQGSCYHFFSVPRASFSHSFRVGLFVTNSVNAPPPKKVLIFIYSRRGKYSLDIRFWIENSCLSCFEKDCAISLWPLWFLMRNLLSFVLCFFPIGEVFFFSGYFQNVFFTFSFWQFNYGVSWRGFIWICPILDFFRFSNLDLYFLPNLETVCTICNPALFFLPSVVPML